MCGIFGAVLTSSKSEPQKRLQIAKDLFRESERRGKEASGLVTATRTLLESYKVPLPSSELLARKGESILLQAAAEDVFAFIGHTRLATNGLSDDNLNNQPVYSGGIVGIHNGIIVNDSDIWKKNPHLHQQTDVDTESLIALLSSHTEKMGINGALHKAYSTIYGTASVALLFNEYDILLLSTNNGSLYVYQDPDHGDCIFASEYRILKKVCETNHLDIARISKITKSEGLAVSLLDGTTQQFLVQQDNHLLTKKRAEARAFRDVSEYPPVPQKNLYTLSHPSLHTFSKSYEDRKERIQLLRRCTKCILPETMPFIQYDTEGVCNYCHFYQPSMASPKDGSLLRKEILSRKKNGQTSHVVNADLIMGFSGGRDSCYGLHVLKQELGLTPIAYTYDWGVITDLGRRNQSRLCAKLGIEHIIVSADIAKKRSYIRKNILAWMRKPDIGLIPLFMAGDKQYFYYLNELAKDIGIGASLLCENPLERTHFKQGFCGITHTDTSTPPYQSSVIDRLKIATYYGKSFLSNKGYINASLLDTLNAYASYYFMPHNYLYLFDYVSWNESQVNKILIDEYDWELAPDTSTTWRIGDGTAPFYNYIYYMVAGLTENDALRSNQIREGMMSRNVALELTEKENNPRWESLLWYFNTIGIPLEETLSVIHQMKPIWEQNNHATQKKD